MKLFFVYAFLLLIPSCYQTSDYTKASLEFNNKHYQVAIDICSEALSKLDQKKPIFIKFLYLRAISYTELKEWDRGIKDYLVLSKNNPGNLEYYMGLSYLYGSNGNTKECAEVLAKAYKINPKHIGILNNLSYYIGQAGSYELSIKYANEGLAIKGDTSMLSSLFNNRGYGYLKLGKYDLALADINEALKHDPENSYAYCYRALVNIQLKKTETVCADLNKAKSLGAVGLTADLIKQNCEN